MTNEPGQSPIEAVRKAFADAKKAGLNDKEIIEAVTGREPDAGARVLSGAIPPDESSLSPGEVLARKLFKSK